MGAVLRLVKQSAEIHPLQKKRQSDIAEQLVWLLDETRAGRVTGLMVIAKIDHGNKVYEHQHGVTGDYRADLSTALKPVLDLFYMVQEKHK